MTQPIFMDFEASSLNRDSYPIEIAWSHEEGTVESYLIKPVAQWTDWDDYAEHQIHGISREQLNKEGVTPQWLVSYMMEKLLGKTIYVDGGEFDIIWCERLFDYKGYTGKLPLDLRHSDECFISEFGQWMNANEEAVKVIQQTVRQQVGGQHRAALDVQYLQGLYCAYKNEGTHFNQGN